MMRPQHQTAILNAAATAIAREITNRRARLDDLDAGGAPTPYTDEEHAKIRELWGAAKSLGVLGAVANQVAERSGPKAPRFGGPGLIEPWEVEP